MPLDSKGRRRGLRIGKYELSGPIALWGPSGAYRAHDADTGRDVFLKLLPAEIAHNAALRERHQREVTKARGLKSPHVIAILDFGEASGTWHLVLEPLEFLGLDEYRTKHGGPSLDDARRLLVQAVAALQHAHHKSALPSELTAASFVIVPRKQGPELRWIPLSLLCEARASVSPRGADYRAPELRQRGSSGSDTRTLIYSLGAILLHLFTGGWNPAAQDPAAALDSLGPDGKELRDLISRMLSRRPEDRFASFEQISETLGVSPATEDVVSEEPDSAAEGSAAGANADEFGGDDRVARGTESARSEGFLEGLRGLAAAEGRDDAQPQRRIAAEEQELGSKDAPGARGKSTARRPIEGEGDDEDSEPASARTAPAKKNITASVPPWVLMAGAVGILALGGVGWLATRRPEPIENKQVKGNDKKFVEQQTNTKEEQPETKKETGKKETPTPKGPPLLYTPSAPLNRRALAQEIEGPWAGPPPSLEGAVVHTVMRVPPASKDATDKKGQDAKAAKYFDSIAAACAAAEKGKTTVVLIHDNGAFYEPAIAIADRNVVVQGAPTYRPLVVWNTAPLSKKELESDPPAALFSMSNGNLLLGNLDVAVDWPAKNAPPVAIARVAQGDLLAWDSAFSLTGDFKAPAAAVRFESKEGDKFKCRLSKCVVRGNAIALDLKAPTAEAFIDESLLVGSYAPLLRVQAGAGLAHPTLRVLRSSLLAGNTILQATAPANPAANPALRWLGWDVFIARDRKDPGGALFELPTGAVADDCRWKATNCVYINFQTLLEARSSISASDHAAWNKQWQQTEGDKALLEPLAVLDGMDPAEIHPMYFRPIPESPFAFAATFSPGVLGADFDKLPYVRPYWRGLATQPIAVPVVEVLNSSKAPPIPTAADGKYYGGRLEIGFGVDLAAFLKDMHRKTGLGSHVVMHLAGTGVRKFSPLYLHNISLTLYVEPPKKGEAPLVLVGDPIDFAPKWQHAYLQLDGGSLEIIGGEFRCPEAKPDTQLKYLIHVRRGNLRIHGARLRGPLAPAKNSLWGLIRFDGSGSENPNLAYGMTVHESTLIAAPLVFHFAYPGMRTRLEKNLIVAPGDALHFEIGAPPSGRANIQCTLENNTIAARQAAIRLSDVPTSFVLGDPILIQSKLNAWQSPFEEPAAVVMYDGAGLTRGFLTWQGESDAFDQRFAGYAVASDQGKLPKLEAPQSFAAWERMFGPLGSAKAIKNLSFKGTLNAESLEKLQLDQLATPAAPKLDPAPGANFERLGLTGKKAAIPKK